MTSTLVTGATGFIGRPLCKALRNLEYEVLELSSSDGDISESATLRSKVGPVDHVFHLAGRTFVPDSWKDPVGFQRINAQGTANVVEYCRTHRARLTFVSAYLYGLPEGLPVTEECPPKPNNPYALSKFLAEQICAFYAAHYGVEVTVVRPFNIFGPGQKGHFLIPQVMRQVAERQPIRVKDLAPRRDYVYIDDLVGALTKTIEGPDGYNIVNIGSGSSVSVGELIAIIQAVAGTSLQVVEERDIRPNEIGDVYADIGKARTLLGWAPTFSFRQGVERMMSGARP